MSTLPRAIQEYFSNDAQVRDAFSDPTATREFVALETPHADLVRSLLLDPDFRVAAPAHCSLECMTLYFTRAEALAQAKRLKEPLAQQLARVDAQETHSIVLSDDPAVESGKQFSKLTLHVLRYNVPVGYRVLGRCAVSCSNRSSSSGKGDGDECCANATNAAQQSSEPVFAVRVVIEPHHLVRIKGTIRLVNGAMQAKDDELTSLVRQYEGKSAERAGDPMPVAAALAVLVMKRRSQTAFTDDIRALLSADEVQVDIECQDDIERDMTLAEQMQHVLTRTLREMGLEPRPGHDARDGDGDDDDEDQMPPLQSESKR